MSERDSFDELRNLIDHPVEPRMQFADQLRSRLMSELSAGENLRQEQRTTMDATFTPRPMRSISVERRRLRPAHLLEFAAAAILLLGLAAIINNGWFQREPEPVNSIPAAVRTDGTPTATPIPTVAQETESPTETGVLLNPNWVLAGTGGEFGGIVADDDRVYRLLKTADFSGAQAIDAKTGVVLWQEPYQWSGTFLVEEHDILFFGDGESNLIAVDAKTGTEQWRVAVDGNPSALEEEDKQLFVLVDSDAVVALDEKSGERLWIAPISGEGTTVGAARVPAIGKIEEKEGVIAAISEHGVIDGFDARTGDVLWSHEGYDVATVALDTKDDHFVLIAGQGISDPTQVIGSMEISDSCWKRLHAQDETPGTPTGGVIWFHSIDPKTGEMIADVQATSAETWAVCQRSVSVGDLSGSIQTLQDEDGIIVRIGAVAGIDQPVAAVALDDGAAFLQLADGSLARVSYVKDSKR